MHNQVNEANAKLDDMQARLKDHGSYQDLLSQEKQVTLDLEKYLSIEETFRQEKARIKWHKKCNRNTTFFHESETMKKAYKKIASLRVNRDILTELDIISNLVITITISCSPSLHQL